MAGGYAAIPGLYRVPDLLTEEQLVEYMKNVYGRTVEFTDDVDTEVVQARALGQTNPMGVVNEDGRPVEVIDPVLREYNSVEAVQTSTDRRAEEVRKEESEETEPESGEELTEDEDAAPDYWSWTKTALETELRKRTLSVVGNKDELVNRLEEDDNK